MTMQQVSRTSYVTGQTFFVVGTTLMIAFACVLGFQSLEWLKTEAWSPISLAAFLNYYNIHLPTASWAPAQIVIDGILGCPFGACLLVLGTVIMCMGESLMKADDRDW